MRRPLAFGKRGMRAAPILPGRRARMDAAFDFTFVAGGVAASETRRVIGHAQTACAFSLSMSSVIRSHGRLWDAVDSPLLTPACEVQMYCKFAFRTGAWLLALAALIGLAAKFAADHAARSEFAALAARVGSLKAGRIAADPWRGGIRLAGVEWDDSSVVVRIGSLRIAAPSLAFGAAIAESTFFGIGTAHAEDVTIETAAATFKIAQINLTGASLSSEELARILDPASSEPIGDRIAQISAAKIAISELVTETKLPLASQRIVYRDISLIDVAGGKAGTASAEGASFSLSDPETGETVGAYGRMHANAVDLALAARIMGQRRTDPAEPLGKVYNDFTAYGFHVSNSKARYELDLGTLTLRAAKGRPLQTALPTEAKSDQASLEREKQAALLWADLLGSVAFDEMEADDLRLALRGGDAPADVSIEHLSAGRLEGAAIEGIETRNFALTTKAAKIGSESLVLRKLNLERLGRALSKVPAEDKGQAGDATTPAVEEIVLTKLAVGLADGASGGDDSPSIFKIDRAHVRGSSEKAGAQMGIDAGVDHFTRSLTPEDVGAFGELSAMGYSRLDVSSRIVGAWSAADNELAMRIISLEGADMGAVQISGLFANVTKDVFSPDRKISTAAALGAQLKKIDLRVDNAGFFERWLQAQANRQGKPVAELRQTYARRAEGFLPALLENAPYARAAGSELAKFIMRPRSFHLVVTAPEGIGLSDVTSIRTPGGLANRLDITAVANE